jgi:ABC-type polysaccharide/polyol phosphate transport system ATPase subunit
LSSGAGKSQWPFAQAIRRPSVGIDFGDAFALGVQIRENGSRHSMLSLSRIEKTFGATYALKSVTLEASAGTVLGLAGENGAGKSTLIKIVSGAVLPDQGSITLDGKQIAPRNTNEAIGRHFERVPGTDPRA